MKTQYQIIKDWITQHGSILPAKMAGVVFEETMFGSECSKRCRELRKMGLLESKQEGRFERFYFKEIKYNTYRVLSPTGEVEKIIKLPAQGQLI